MSLLSKLNSVKPILVAGLLSILQPSLLAETQPTRLTVKDTSWDEVQRVELLRSTQTGKKISEKFYTPVYYEGRVEGNQLVITYCTTHREDTNQDPAWISQKGTRTYVFVPQEVFITESEISQQVKTATRFSKLTTAQLVPQSESKSTIFYLSQEALKKLEEAEKKYVEGKTGGLVDKGFTDFAKYLGERERQNLQNIGEANSPDEKYKCIVLPSDWTKAEDRNMHGFEYSRTIRAQLKSEHEITTAPIYIAHFVKIEKETPEERLSQTGEGFAIAGPINTPINYVEPLLLPEGTRLTTDGEIILPDGKTIAKNDKNIRETLAKYQVSTKPNQPIQTTSTSTNSSQTVATAPQKDVGKTLEKVVEGAGNFGRGANNVGESIGRIFGLR